MLNRRIYVNAPNIYRSEAVSGARYRVFVDGMKFLLRSDFPVIVYDGDTAVAWAGGGALPQAMRFGYKSGRTRRLDFRFPPGFGGDFLGGAGSTIQVKHGIAVLESAWDDEPDPKMPEIRQLPAYNWVFSAAVAPAATAGNISHTPGVNDFMVVPGTPHRIQELWISSVSVNIEIAGALMPAAGNYPYELFSIKLPSGVVTDSYGIFSVFGGVDPSWTQSLGLFKIPWASLMQPWNAEAPTVLDTIYLSQAWAAGGTVNLRFNGFYTD